jgi:NADH-quinone oxidoreductase subunit J
MGNVIAFWVLALVAVLSGMAVVALRSVFRSALALILCFLAVAGIFVLLNADFLAAVQVLVYVGAVAILVILAIMLTHEVEKGNLANKLRVPALISSLLLVGLTVYSLLKTAWPESQQLPPDTTASALGNILFGQDEVVLIVQVAAFIVLATIIGAISIAREK